MSNFETHAWSRFLPRPPDDIAGGLPSTRAHAGQSVFVTGAGGYIGSALVKAIAAAGPRNIILLDSSEQNLFEIERDMESAFAPVRRHAFLGSVRDRPLLDAIFSRFHPEMVYHAAAFKHVPLLEQNPFAAVRNNAIGTYILVQAALLHETPSLVLISTDKAVNPHSVLGVSKRIAELVVVALSSASCKMNAIRLGNVIGSGGSVVPAFLKQIAQGGPVTVTHADATRWFLSLHETVEAVLGCGMAPYQGRILVPELSEPVSIAGLARFLIGAAKVPVVFTGLRPGEKLTEELISPTEIQEEAIGGSLRVIRTCALAAADVDIVIEKLESLVANRDLSGLLRVLSSTVPEYLPSEILR